MFISIKYEEDPQPCEGGDTIRRSVLLLILRLGYTCDSKATTGEKRKAMLFKDYIVTRLRSTQFRQYMTSRGIEYNPGKFMDRVWPDPFNADSESLRIYYIRMRLITYIENYIV